MKNPLSGLVICGQCGRAMVRRPYGNGYPDGLLCPYTSCSCVSSTLATVEAAILDGLRSWLVELDLTHESAAGEGRTISEELASIQTALNAAAAEGDRLRGQRMTAYDLVEQGVYTPDVFTARMTALGAQISAVEAQIAVLSKDLEALEAAQAARSSLLPNVKRVLDVYDQAETPEEKNALLRSVLEKVVYRKTRRERWAGGSDLSLTLYPIVK